MKKRNATIVWVAGILLTFILTGCQKETAEFPVTKARAKEIAIEQLGVPKQDTSYAVVNNAGSTKDPYYDVEVLLQGVVYRYSIDPENGDIRKLTINDQNVRPEEQPAVPSVAKTEYIGLDRAKELAFQDAGVSADQAQKFDYEMDFAYGKYLYDIEFFADGHKYEYEITADSGELFEKNVDRVTVVEPSVETDLFIGVERAKEIALAHAAVEAADAHFDAVEWKMKNASPIYEVEFKTAKGKCDYYIHAVTGEVIHHFAEIKKESDRTDTNPDHSATHDHLTAEEAKGIALRHAGVNEADAKHVKAELDFERGVEAYEVEFEVGKVEYDYQINAKTGEVIKAERDYGD